MRLLVELVLDGIASGLCPGAQFGVAVLGHVLVALLGCSTSSTLDALGERVECVSKSATTR